MLVRETWAVCAGCGDRVLVETDVHPAFWPSMVDGGETRHFCSRACLVESSGGNVPLVAKRLPNGLNLRDVELLQAVAQGYSNQAIAIKTHYSTSAVKNRLARIGEKFDMPATTFGKRFEIVLYAHSIGVINLNVEAQRYAVRARLAA